LFYRSAFAKKQSAFGLLQGRGRTCFIRVLLKKKQSAFGLLQGRGRTCFIRVLLKKKQSAFGLLQSAFGTATLLVNYILLKSELVRVFGGKWPFRHKWTQVETTGFYPKLMVLCIPFFSSIRGWRQIKLPKFIK
jgi:hypothetical protein